MPNRVFPDFDTGEHDQTLAIPHGPTMHARRKNAPDEAFVSAILPPAPGDPDQRHLLQLSADRVGKGEWLQSLSYLDGSGRTKLKVFARGGEVRITLRLGDGDSRDVRTIRLEQLEAFMATIGPDGP